MRAASLLLGSLLMGGGCTGAAAADLPLLRGSARGELQLWGEAGTTVPWRVEVEPQPDGGTTVGVTVEPPDGAVRARLELLPDGRNGRWKIEQAEFAAGPWWRRLAAQLAPAVEELEIEGRLIVSGGGEWRDGAPVEGLRVEWLEGRVSSADPAATVEGLQVGFDVAPGWLEGRLAGEGRLRFAEAAAAGLIAAHGTLDVALAEEGRLQVGPATMEALGGRIQLAPFTWSAGQTSLPLAVRVERVEVDELAALAPEALREAEGRVSGDLLLRWTEETGLVPVDGGLRVAEGSEVQLRLAARPGFLTERVPRRLQVLPDWLGVVARRWFAPVNPAYQTLEDIELGRQPLVVDNLEVTFFPPDDPLDRSARIALSGRPVGDALVEQLSIVVNLNGPLAEVLRLGFDERVRIQASAD